MYKNQNRAAIYCNELFNQVSFKLIEAFSGCSTNWEIPHFYELSPATQE